MSGRIRSICEQLRASYRDRAHQLTNGSFTYSPLATIGRWEKDSVKER